MAKYEVIIKASAEKELLTLPNDVVAKVLTMIYSLAEHPHQNGTKKLKGSLPPCFRARVGNYRIVYKINNQELVVHVLAIGHRKEIYR